MATRVVTVTIDGRTTTVRSTDPGRVLNVGPAGPQGATGATGAAGTNGTNGTNGVDGTDGADGQGVPTGGTTGQALVKASNTDFDTEWSDASGGGAVDSVNGQTGVVVLDADDIADGTTNHAFTAADDTKLAGIASGATANATDAQLRDRSTHTGTQLLATISDAGTAAAADTGDFEAAGAVATHSADTTSVHGIADTSALALTGDAPTAHAASHQDGGTDELALDGSQITTGTVADARVAPTIARDSEVAATYAPLASPALTGNPTAPTPSQGDNDTSIATTAYVQTEAGLLVPKSLVDAKGDLLVGSADNTVARLAVGSDGQVLTADAASTNGVKWAAASGGSSTPTPDDPASSPSSYDYEFAASDTTSLPSGWSEVDPTGNGSYRERRGVGTYIQTSNGSSPRPLSGIVRALPTESTWTAYAKIQNSFVGGALQVFGLALRDSATAKSATYGKRIGTSQPGVNWLLFSAAQTLGSESPGTAVGVGFGSQFYVGIKRNSASSYDGLISEDGANWRTVSSAQNPGFTADQIGILGWSENSQSFHISVSWFRVEL